MTLADIHSNLCAFDDRNPYGMKDNMDADDYAEAQAARKESCSCDNCFYGRTALALMLLQTVSVVQEFVRHDGVTWHTKLNGDENVDVELKPIEQLLTK